MRDIDTADGPVVLPGDGWDLQPADPEDRVLGLLILFAGETDVWTYVDQQFLLDLRAIVENGAVEVPWVEGDGYGLSRINGVLYVAVTDHDTSVTIECAPQGDFLAAIQEAVDRRRAADAQFYLSRTVILVVTIAVIAALWVLAPHVVA